MTVNEAVATTKPVNDQVAAIGDPVVPAGVRVVDLVCKFGDLCVLNGVSFDIPEGKVCTLLGSSGSGKTTTLRIIAGLGRPDSGEVWIGGRPMVSNGLIVPAEKRNIGMFFQSYGLWPHKNVFNQIAYPLKVRRIARDEIRSAVHRVAEMLGIERFLERFPSELSGGQQQRVALARALVFGPSLLLLDEPLSNLDAALRRQTRLELQRLQAELKMTTIYVTHDQEEAMAMSDMVVLMDKGEISSIASARETFDRPKSVYGASFVGASNLFHGSVTSLDGGRAVALLKDGSVVEGVAHGDLVVGEEIVVAIKPVDLVLGKTTPAATNQLEAAVVSATYLGPQVELELSAGGTVFRMPDSRWSSLKVGDCVPVVLPPEYVNIFRPVSRSGSPFDRSEGKLHP